MQTVHEVETITEEITETVTELTTYAVLKEQTQISF